MPNITDLFDNLYFTYDFVVKTDPNRAKTIPDSDYIIARDKNKNSILLVKGFNIWSPEERDKIRNDPQVQMILNMVIMSLLKSNDNQGQRPFERAQGDKSE